MKHAILLAALVSVVVALPATEPVSAACDPKCLLQTQKRGLTRIAKRQARAIRRLRHHLVNARYTRDYWIEKSKHLEGEIASRDARITQLSSDVPARIRAVPLANFRDAVFRPAFETWPCRDFYATTGAWSYTFYSDNLC